MQIKYNTPYQTFLLALDALSMTAAQLDACLQAVGGQALPESLKYDFFKLSFGKFASLQQIKTGADFMVNSFLIILFPDEQVAAAIAGYPAGGLSGWLKRYRLACFRHHIRHLPTGQALRFIRQVKTDFEKAIKLFEAIRYTPQPDERMAGIERTKGGLFAVADYYARRMGISDHDQVYRIPWIRIYAVLKLDMQDHQYQRRLQEVKEARAKRP